MEDPESVARGICLRALTGTAKTRKQLADILAKKGVPDEAAAAVLDRYTEVGLIDDAAFAAAWVSTRQSGRGLARRALSAELRAKGVDGELAAAAVAEVDPQDEWDSARKLVERKMPSMRRLDRVTAERRLVGMLARKGYGGGLAGHVVREALDALDEERTGDWLPDAAPSAPPTDDASTGDTSTGGAFARSGSSFGGSRSGGARSGAGRSAWRRGAAAAPAEEEVDEPLAGDDPDAPAPVPWSRERSAARAAARAAAADAADGDAADGDAATGDAATGDAATGVDADHAPGDEDRNVTAEVGEGRARPIGRLRPPPGALPVDDLP